MRQFRPDHLMVALRFVRGAAEICIQGHESASEAAYLHLIQRLTELGQVCERAGLVVSKVMVDRTLLSMTVPEAGLHPVDIRRAVDTVEMTIESECQTILFYSVNADRRHYFTEYGNGWEEAIARFSEIRGDVEEAGKCFALGRYAGSVFHSIHACELGVIQLGKFLNVADPRPGWSATTNALDLIMKKKYQDRTNFERTHFIFLEQMHGAVNALKNSWRNKIDHAHDRLVLMTTDFNDHVAEEIILSTRAFMRRLATELPT